MIFQVFSTGPTKEDLGHFLQLLSHYLENEWEKSTKEVAEGGGEKPRTGTRLERYNFALKGCLTFFFLLQARPAIPIFYETFADVCGSVQAGAAWILSTIVNSYCDKIRSLGVRCIISYVERTSKSPDLPLELERSTPSEPERPRTMESRSIQENAFSLISNVGQGLLNTNVAKNLASMGPSVRYKQLSLTKLTARVVYKLMWHLLKSHRFRLGQWTNGSLLSMVFEESGKAQIPLNALMENFLTDDDVFQDSIKINLEWSYRTLEKVNDGPFGTPNNSLGVSTMTLDMLGIGSEFCNGILHETR